VLRSRRLMDEAGPLLRQRRERGTKGGRLKVEGVDESGAPR
jgi:hypothetical protein